MEDAARRPLDMRRSVQRRVPRGFVVTVVVALLAGCAPTAADSRPPQAAPTVVWLDPVTSGPFDGDPWLQAIRDDDLAVAAAVNTTDFDDPGLLRNQGEYGVEALRRWLSDDIAQGDVTLPLGPRPFTPLRIDVAADGRSARILGCATRRDYVRSDVRWELDSTRWPAPWEYTVTARDDGNGFTVSGQVRNRELMFTPKGNQDLQVLPDGRLLTYALCAATEIPRGVYDPPPDLQRLMALDPERIWPSDSWRITPTPSPS